MIRNLTAYMLMIFTSSYAYNIVPKDIQVFKKPLYFFSANLKNNVPQELYHTFIDYLKEDYDVKVNVDNIDLYEPTIFNKEVLLLSHSSGANQLMNIYDNLNETINKKAVLIDPLDFQKYSVSVPSFTSFSVFPTLPKQINIDINLEEIDQSLKNIFEMDYMEELKTYIFQNEGMSEDNHNNKILILNHKKSDQWKTFPMVPPINSLKMEFNSLENTTIIQKSIDKEFSHFDILDRPWANSLNKWLFPKEQPETDKISYFDEVVPIIQDFYKNM